MRIRTAQPDPGSPSSLATGARARSGSHHSRCAAYQSTVSASPCSQSTDGAQPSSCRSLEAIEDVAAVVARAVGHDRLQRLRLAEDGEDPVGDIHDGGFDPAPHVIRLAQPAAGEHDINGGAVVAHVQPFHRLAVLA